MIIAVGGIASIQDNNYQSEYKREFYQPKTELELKEDIKQDFGEILAEETNKLKIDVLI